ncbi:unnamed protein product, partial [Gulo gulo]
STIGRRFALPSLPPGQETVFPSLCAGQAGDFCRQLRSYGLDAPAQVVLLDPAVGLTVPELRMAWPAGAALLPLQFSIDRLQLAGSQVPFSPSLTISWIYCKHVFV